MKTPDLSLPRVAAPALLLIALAGCDQSGTPTASSTATAPEVATTEAAKSTAAAETPNAKPAAATPAANDTTVRGLTASTAATAPTSIGKKPQATKKGAGNANDLTIPARTTGGNVVAAPLDITFDPPKLDLGMMQPGVPKTGTVTITNNGSEPVQIKKAVASCGCTTPMWPREPIGPGETAEMEITLKPSLKQGQRLSKRKTSSKADSLLLWPG